MTVGVQRRLMSSASAVASLSAVAASRTRPKGRPDIECIQISERTWILGSILHLHDKEQISVTNPELCSMVTGAQSIYTIVTTGVDAGGMRFELWTVLPREAERGDRRK